MGEDLQRLGREEKFEADRKDAPQQVGGDAVSIATPRLRHVATVRLSRGLPPLVAISYGGGHLGGAAVIEQWLTGPRGRGNAPAPRDLVQSVRRAVQLMEILGSEPGLTVKQTARRVALTSTTAHPLIRTLGYEVYPSRGD